ncbi:MAG: glycosyltransferase family 2 protein [Gemmatimonadaceae bacterium]
MVDAVPVGVILLNWNGTADTLAALESLWQSQPRPRRVVVVDNGSAQESVQALREWVEAHDNAWARVLELSTNAGFPGGNNAGLADVAQDSSIDFFLLLNNDATVAPDFFTEIMDGVAARPDGSLYTSTIYEADRKTLWYAGGTEHRHRALVLHSVKKLGGAPADTEFISGCVMLIPRRTYAALGGLAEVYFPLYWEDVEYSFRARAAVGPLVYAPRAVAYHKVGATVGGGDVTPRVAFVQNHHRAMFVRRNFRGSDRAIALGYLLVTKPARFVKEVLKGNAKVGAATLSGALRGMLLTDPERGLPPKALARR